VVKILSTTIGKTTADFVAVDVSKKEGGLLSIKRRYYNKSISAIFYLLDKVEQNKYESKN